VQLRSTGRATRVLMKYCSIPCIVCWCSISRAAPATALGPALVALDIDIGCDVRCLSGKLAGFKSKVYTGTFSGGYGTTRSIYTHRLSRLSENVDLVGREYRFGE
jgi:hypothetical protein